MKPKRYLLFHCDTYYPSGGWADLVGSFDSIEAIVEALGDGAKLWWLDHHIVDLETGELVNLDKATEPAPWWDKPVVLGIS